MRIVNQVIAHRGASAYAPENTLAAFNRALALGASCVEFDVMLSADGFLFVFHDDSVKRTTNGQGDIGLLNARYIETLDAGSWFSKAYTGEKIPSCQDALEWLIFSNVDANIEIKPYKNTAGQATALALITELNAKWPSTRPLPLVSSFDREALKLCRAVAPELPLGFLMHDWDDECLSLAKELACYSMHVHYTELTPARISLIKEAGFQLYAYTVNSKRRAKALCVLGVDAVFSDYPDLLMGSSSRVV